MEIYIDIRRLKVEGAIKELLSAIELELHRAITEGENTIKLAQEIIHLTKEYYKIK